MRVLIRRVIAVGLVVAAYGAAAPLPAETIDWKPITNAVLKVDERPARVWELYVTEKRKHVVLLQLGARFLKLDLEAQDVTEVAESALERRGGALRWKEGQQQTKLESEDWTQKHAGRARIIRLRLVKEGRRIELQLPVAPDLRKFY